MRQRNTGGGNEWKKQEPKKKKPREDGRADEGDVVQV